MINIAIGTLSEQKIEVINKVIKDLAIDAKVKSLNVFSEVSDQPCEKGETQKGSINRALNAFKSWNEADLGLGIEFGYEPYNDTYKMICWATIYTKDKKIFSEASSSLELPSKLIRGLEKDVSVNSLLPYLYNEIENSPLKSAAQEYINKKRVFYESIKNVLIRYCLDSVWYN